MASVLFGMKAYRSDRPIRSSGRHWPLASQPASPKSLAPLAFALTSQGSAASSRLTKPTLVAGGSVTRSAMAIGESCAWVTIALSRCMASEMVTGECQSATRWERLRSTPSCSRVRQRNSP